MLPPAVLTAKSTRGPADTVRRLELAGFYERRNTTGAPRSAFVTAERIARFTMLSDVSRIVDSRRDFCGGNLYLDGVRVDVPENSVGRRRTGGSYKSGLDALLDPKTIAGIEFYSVADAPSAYNITRPSGPARCGVTLIWTK